MHSKGQVWTIDFIIGMLIFIGLICTVAFIIRGALANEDKYTDVLRESDHIASLLMGETESNGTLANSVKISEHSRINETMLRNFSDIEYNRTKLLLQTSGDYVFYFYNGSIMNYSGCFRGYKLEPDCELAIPSSAKNIAHSERIVILNSTIVRLDIITWN